VALFLQEQPTRLCDRCAGLSIWSIMFHQATPGAADPTDLHIQGDSPAPTRQIPNALHLPVVEGPVYLAARAADCFPPRRCSRTTRACGSPKMPWTVCRGRKPGKRYASQSRRWFGIRKSCHVSPAAAIAKSLVPQGHSEKNPYFFPTRLGEDPTLLVDTVQVLSRTVVLVSGESNEA
jgi:hypothetical protein